ncbi:unnamed protein product [Camellia sinensis]
MKGDVKMCVSKFRKMCVSTMILGSSILAAGRVLNSISSSRWVILQYRHRNHRYGHRTMQIRRETKKSLSVKPSEFPTRFGDEAAEVV